MDIKETMLFGREGVKVFSERPVNLLAAFKPTFDTYSQKMAVITEQVELTYEQLNKQSTNIAGNFQQKFEIEKGDRVAVLIGNRSEFPLIALACIKTGAIMVPINTKLAAEEIRYILDHSKPKILLVEDEYLKKVEEATVLDAAGMHSIDKVIPIGEEGKLALIEKPELPLKEVETKEEDGAYILYTSGTTGKPKGAILSHVNVIHSLMNYNHVFQTDEEMRTLLAVPMFHVTGLVGQLLHMFYIGGTVCSMKRYQNEDYIHRVINDKINFLFNVPTIFIMMSTSEEFQKHQFDFVKKIAFGGSPIYQETYQMLKKAFPNAKLHNAYGSTETTSPVTLMPMSYSDSKVTSVGPAVPVADIKIMIDDAQEAPIGVPGELYIKGPMVIGEYWDNEAANATSFSDGYWKSGDLGIVDEDGYFYIRDRKKDMINRAGEKIFSIEVEDVLKSHPDIVEAAVIGEPDPVFGERVKAFLVMKHPDSIDFEKLREYCLTSLAKFKVPQEFEIIEELPRNASGKILKNTLKNIGGKQNA